MAFEPQHLKALQDKLGHEVAEELDKLHEKVFPTKKSKDTDDTESKSE